MGKNLLGLLMKQRLELLMSECVDKTNSVCLWGGVRGVIKDYEIYFDPFFSLQQYYEAQDMKWFLEQDMKCLALNPQRLKDKINEEIVAMNYTKRY